MKKDEEVYLGHILDAITRIKKYLKHTKTFDAFEKDEKTMDAVLHQLQIIGEAAKRVGQETKNKLSEIPWKDITGIRDILVHDYFAVDSRII